MVSNVIPQVFFDPWQSRLERAIGRHQLHHLVPELQAGPEVGGQFGGGRGVGDPRVVGGNLLKGGGVEGVLGGGRRGAEGEGEGGHWGGTVRTQK